jgi:sugar lactone lactonase YvrE
MSGVERVDAPTMPQPSPHPRKRRRWVRIALFALIAVLVAPLIGLGVFLIAVPTPTDGFSPESWEPGELTPFPAEATIPAAVHQLSDQRIHGPEDVVVDGQGRAYTGDRDGIIWRFPDDGGDAQRWADVGGRPLGMSFAADGRLIVANHGLGLQAVSPDGTVEILVDAVAGAPILFANDLDISSDGVVYFSDSSSRYNTTTLGPDSSSYLLPDAIDGRASGRLLAHDLVSGRTRVLLDDVYFPNGVALTADESAVWVAESNRYRLIEYNLADGATTTLLDNLPGTPDNIDRDADGRMLVAIYERNSALDSLVLPFDLARQVLIRLPSALFVNEEDPLSGGIIVAAPDGNVDRYVAGLTPAATSAHPVGDRWYLGALLGQPVRWMEAP